MTNFGIIGCGGIGSSHISGWDALRPRMRVVAAVDTEESRARAAAERIGAARWATDVHHVLVDVDAVLLSLPHHLHHPVGMACLAAGKHVLMEKPLANTEQQCLDLIHAADRAGRVLMVAYPWPYHPLYLRMKELLDEKAYGEVFQVSIWTEQHTQYAPGHWAMSAETLGGGQLFSHGCHYIDLLLRFLGSPVEGTHVGTNYGTPWMEREGTSNVAIKFRSGALGYHFGTWGAKGTRLGYSFHAHCTEGMLEMHMASGRLIAHRGGEESVLLEVEPGKFLSNEMEHFLTSLETGGRPLTDGPRSLQGLRVIWRLYEAEQRGVVADLSGLGLDEGA